METKETEIVKQIATILKNTPHNNKYQISIKTYEDFFSDKFLVISVIRTGVTFSLFESISSMAPFTIHQWATYLDISLKSLQRYKKQEQQFKPSLSEKIIELAEVTYKGIEVFGSKEKFELWLNTPNFALGNNKPIELLKDSYGKEMVIDELVRIEHGILG